MAVAIERIFPTDVPRRRRRAFVSRGQEIRFYALLFAVAVLSVCNWARGRGYISDLKQLLRPAARVAAVAPSVAMTFPPDGAVGMPSDLEIVAEIKSARNGGIDAASARDAEIVLVRTSDQEVVPSTFQFASPSRLKLKPSTALEAGTNYTFYVGPGLKDRAGGDVVPCAISFATAAPADPRIRFAKVLLRTTSDVGFTCVAVGPGRMLYGSSDDGRIFRFAILADGTLSPPKVFESLRNAAGGPRLITGFCFDRASTPAEPILWVSHGFYGFENAPDFSGKITRLSGRDLATVEDVVVNLPRSVRDHLTNQPSFGPDGALYIPQGSNTSFGAPDNIWGDRPERLLSASILRLDTEAITPGKPLDARTPDGGGSFDPYARNAPLTIYASGVRLAYDMVWTTEGELYVPTNGSSAGGNAPGSSAQLANIPISEDDWLFRIVPGKYYGHPNPQQGFYVLNGANPTAGYDFGEVVQYTVGTLPERKWVPAAYSFGKHASANGIIQYKSSAFAGALRGKLLVCRYNVPGDIAVLQIEAGKVTSLATSIPGFAGLANPLDLAEDVDTGKIYVSEYGARRITLLRPINK
jgi:glucose/arabinose dehydrogenase